MTHCNVRGEPDEKLAHETVVSALPPRGSQAARLSSGVEYRMMGTPCLCVCAKKGRSVVQVWERLDTEGRVRLRVPFQGALRVWSRERVPHFGGAGVLA